MIETPESIKEPFYLRKAELSAENRVLNSMDTLSDLNQTIVTIYNYVRDTPGALKNAETKNTLQTKLLDATTGDITEDQKLQIYILLEQFFAFQSPENPLKRIIESSKQIENTINRMEIIAFKKRALMAIKEYRKDWAKLFLEMFFNLPQSQLRDYILKELNHGDNKEKLIAKLDSLLNKPTQSPDAFLWYFQKLISNEDKEIPFNGSDGQIAFFEAFFVLVSLIENQPECRDVVKKMYNLLTTKRYEQFRNLIQGTTAEFAKELLLLISKCQTFTTHDKKILRSLVEVVHPELAAPKVRKGFGGEIDDDIIWTTEEGYLKIQERIKQIGTVEMIENAKEIEAARSLGDLRENSEFKFAQEKRSRLQSELKTLSDQMKKSRIITPNDIHHEEVGVGSIVSMVDSKGAKLTYSILGPWDADPENNILSFNSKLALAMAGKKMGEQFEFKDETFKITNLKSCFSE